jgi:NitT/TauT family transport system ATP-binding protein
VMTSRPGRVQSEIVVDAPYPRDAGYRTSPLYNEHCRSVSDALEKSMAHA